MELNQVMATAQVLLDLMRRRDELTVQITDEAIRLKLEKIRAREEKKQAAIAKLEARLEKMKQKQLSKEAGNVGLAAKKAARKPGPVISMS